MKQRSFLQTIRFGENVLRFRIFIGLALLAFTAWMGYQAAQITVRTSFIDFFPRSHPNVLLTREWATFGGADIVTLMVKVRQGDIFNLPTLKLVQSLTFDIDKVPGVNHDQLFSLASGRVTYVRAVPGALETRNFMYPHLPKDQAGVDRLKRLVTLYRERLGYLVSRDNKAAVIRIGLNPVEYRQFFNDIMALVAKYRDANHDIYAAGEPITRGYGYYYEPTVAAILLGSIIAMIVILYLFLGQRSRWWAPIITGSFSAIWGLGYVGLMSYDFDPVMLVIPFILTARDVSHGIQWQGRYYDEIDRLRDKYAACIATTDRMLPPGFLSIIADIAGIIFIALGGIPVLAHIGFAGAVWLAGSLTMVFIFQPILMSFLPMPQIRETKRVTGVYRVVESFFGRLARIPVTPGRLRGGILVAALIILVWGIASGLREPVGYEFVGTPLYKPTARVNREIQAINRYFPTDEGWVVMSGMPPYPDPQSAVSPPVLRMTNEMREYILEDPDVASVTAYGPRVVMPANNKWHYDYPKFMAIPSTVEVAGNLFYLYGISSTSGDMAQLTAGSDNHAACIRILMFGHTATALTTLERRLKDFMKLRVDGLPELSKIKVEFLGSTAGLYAAANDVLKELDFLNITFVLCAVTLFSIFAFRSVVAGLLFLFACVLANFGAFIYLRLRDISLTIDTIPVISLGIGLGVDYGIYTVARIRDEVMEGVSLSDAISVAVTHTGTFVFSTFCVMVGGILLWAFSPVLFHSQMSVLLMFLMGTNMVAGVVVLPCYIAWARPKFITAHERSEAAEAPENALATDPIPTRSTA